MTRCQVPEKSNNVWNSLICYTWLQLQPLGLNGKVSRDWSTLGTNRERDCGCTLWDTGGQVLTCPCTHRHAHTHTFSYVHVKHIQFNTVRRCIDIDGQRSSVELDETWEHWPLLHHHFPAEKNRKKVREKERKGGLCQVTHPRGPANGLRSIKTHSYYGKIALGWNTKILWLGLHHEPQTVLVGVNIPLCQHGVHHQP